MSDVCERCGNPEAHSMGERTLCEACFAVVNSCCTSEFLDFETYDPDPNDNTKGVEPEA